METDVKQKDKEIDILNQRLEDQSNIYSSSVKTEDKLKVRRCVSLRDLTETSFCFSRNMLCFIHKRRVSEMPFALNILLILNIAFVLTTATLERE